ncbi:MAG: hypothetical protein JST93_14770 [Acidobacteria bacterium]|nr:hypothetical protein [Acidobacteriota bacterium]
MIRFPQALTHLRSVDLAQAIQILESIDYYLRTGAGDIMRVRHRSEAYR